MAAVPVHENFGPFVSLHLIVVSLGAIIQKEPHPPSSGVTVDHSSFSLTASWAAHSSAPLEVFLAHPTLSYLISSPRSQLLGSLCSEQHCLWTQLVSC